MNFMEKFSVAGKNIIVTGGARGIGKCVAEVLAQCGANVGIMDIDIKMADAVSEAISKQYGNKTIAYECDVSKIEMVEHAFASFLCDFCTLDAVFNNAGIAVHNKAEDMTADEWLNIINVNLNGVFYVAQAAGKQFIKEKKNGSIVNVASMSGIIVNIPQCQASYNASKAAVIQLTKTLAVEWAEKGIRVNCISPGYIITEMTSTLRQDWRDFWVNLIPFKRMGRPEELAGAVIYLMSDASSYTSGHNIVIDGCFTCV